MTTSRTLSGDHCRCTACGLYFNSTAAFDKHRSGPYASRRCLAVPEMLEIGMGLSSDWWVTARMPVRTVPHWQNSGDLPEGLPEQGSEPSPPDCGTAKVA